MRIFSLIDKLVLALLCSVFAGSSASAIFSGNIGPRRGCWDLDWSRGGYPPWNSFHLPKCSQGFVC